MGGGLLDVLSGALSLKEATGRVYLNGSSAAGGRLGVLASAGRFRDPARLFESVDIADRPRPGAAETTTSC